jgi:DNA-binding FrmR family transcriptional regulator
LVILPIGSATIVNTEVGMKELPVPRTEIGERLKKIEGQVKGVQKMVEAQRDCEEIIVQLAAIRAGLESVAGMVLRNYAVVCAANKGGYIAAELAHAVSIWVGGRGR